MEIQNSKFNIQDSRFKIQNLKIRLHVMSPIHIGCDDVYEPTSFVIDEKGKRLIEFDPVEFIKALNDKERDELNRVISSDSLLAIYKAIKRLYKQVLKGKEVDVTDAIVEHYKKVLSMGTFDKKAIINQFTINKTAYNPHSSKPYIPGSSLKGSLRTAYLNALAKVKNITNWRGNTDDLETRLLDRREGKEKMSSDPFRMVKVSDLIPAGDIRTKIVYAVNRKKKKNDKETLAGRGGVYQIFETVQPGAIFEGILNVSKPEESSGISLQVTVDDLKSSLNKFYIPLLEAEIKTLKELDISVPLINIINSKFKGQINKTAFIVSLGRHSGAEAVTIEGNRKIKIRQKDDKYKYLDHSTTLWLASDEPKPKNNNNLQPFGWAVIEVLEAF
jgi:CRISPR-associated protein Csm5